MGHYHFDPETKSFFPSVTTILSAVLPEPPALTNWKKKTSNWEEITKHSQVNGTIIHFAILNPLSGGILDPRDLPPMWKWYPDTSSKVELATMMWKEMLKRERKTLGFPRLIEHKVINRKEKYSGKLDLLCPVNEIQTLVDLKTSARVRESHELQLGGYYAAIPEEEKPEQACIIILSPDPDKNPKLTGKIHMYPKPKVELLASKFIELAREFHNENPTPRDEVLEIE